MGSKGVFFVEFVNHGTPRSGEERGMPHKDTPGEKEVRLDGGTCRESTRDFDRYLLEWDEPMQNGWLAVLQRCEHQPHFGTSDCVVHMMALLQQSAAGGPLPS
jgi:hypothetical protein